jgi:AraC family transcriptional regulator of adaptative response / methylphosphotriester-DNA alkyltransferase methyltransferase
MMIDRLDRPLSISAIAAALHISPRQLQRDFLACTGLSPVAYGQMLRLSEANMLLASTTLPIGTVAARLGYANAAHFSAAFRRLYHCTPSQIREQREDASALATMEDVYGCQY